MLALPVRAHPQIAGRRRAPPKPARKTSGAGQKYAAAAAALLCAWTVYADPLARQTALRWARPLIAAVLPEPPPLTLGAASARRVEADGQTVLYVEGSLRNQADRTLKAPTLLVTIVGDDGRPLYAWKAKPAGAEIKPSAEVGFKTRLASPPLKFQSLVVSLADGG